MNLLNLFEIKKQNLSFFGWLSIIYTIISIPYFVIVFVMAFANPHMAEGNVLGSLISILYAFIFVAIIYFFKILLNKRYKFHKANKALSAFIYANLLITVGLEVFSYLSLDDGLQAIVTFAMLIPLGITYIIVGIRLLALDNTLFGIKKSLTINLILTGVFMASIVLFLIAIIPSLIVTGLLGVLFLREASKA